MCGIQSNVIFFFEKPVCLGCVCNVYCVSSLCSFLDIWCLSKILLGLCVLVDFPKGRVVVTFKHCEILSNCKITGDFVMLGFPHDQEPESLTELKFF